MSKTLAAVECHISILNAVKAVKKAQYKAIIATNWMLDGQIVINDTDLGKFEFGTATQYWKGKKRKYRIFKLRGNEAIIFDMNRAIRKELK